MSTRSFIAKQTGKNASAKGVNQYEEGQCYDFL